MVLISKTGRKAFLPKAVQFFRLKLLKFLGTGMKMEIFHDNAVVSHFI